jgi:hypothetical protein
MYPTCIEEQRAASYFPKCYFPKLRELKCATARDDVL